MKSDQVLLYSVHGLTFLSSFGLILQEKDKKEDDANEFVSAVCWRTVSKTLIVFILFLRL